MSQMPQMPPARRRPVPGITPALAAPPPPNPTPDDDPRDLEPATAAPARATPAPSSSQADKAATSLAATAEARRPGAAVRGRRAADYATTRLVNFRIPVDLHDRYRQLVRDTEQRHPRLRHPSLTELVIALLEDGPESAEEVAALIRRKRAAEHAEEVSA
jgi:uncharacterized protein (DUF4415 family)